MTILPPIPSVKSLLSLYKISAKAHLGQHFLLHRPTLDRITAAALPNLSSRWVLEIGPGPGTLTRSLLEHGAKIIAIEKDSRFLSSLQTLAQASSNRLSVIHGDALEIDPDQVVNRAGPPSVIVGNLPFNVATPLFMQWVHQIAGRRGYWAHDSTIPLVLLFQKEVGEAMMAEPNSASYGRLSLATQLTCTVSCVGNIKGSVFVPRTKVDASILRFDPRPDSPNEPTLAAVESLSLHLLGHRRKMLLKSLSFARPNATRADNLTLLESIKVDPSSRPAELAPEQWIKLIGAIQISHGHGEDV